MSQIRGEQIRKGVITNDHISEATRIDESKLNIDWTQHYQEALRSKKLVDYVQVNGVNAGGLSEVNLTALGIIDSSEAAVSSNDVNSEGIIVDAPKNYAPIRNAETGEPVLDGQQREIFGRVEVDTAGGSNTFMLRFYVKDDDGNEVQSTIPENTTIDFQYAQRFNLADVSELFASNEKFVDGAADKTAHLNIMQLAKDLYGSSYQLNRNGNALLGKDILTRIQEIEDVIENLDESGSGGAPKKPYDAYYVATGGETTITLEQFSVPNLPPYEAGSSNLSVFLNGLKQNKGLHYNEDPSGQSITFTSPLVKDDVVSIYYYA